MAGRGAMINSDKAVMVRLGLAPMQQPSRMGAVEEALKSVSPIKLNEMPSLSNVRCAPIDSPYQNGSGASNCKLATANGLAGRPHQQPSLGRDLRKD